MQEMTTRCRKKFVIDKLNNCSLPVYILRCSMNSDILVNCWVMLRFSKSQIGSLVELLQVLHIVFYQLLTF